MASEHVCAVERSVGYHVRRCGKPAKGQLSDGRWACGVHLAAARRREERTVAREQRWAAIQAFQDEVAALRERHGIVGLNGSDPNLRRVSLGLDTLRAILERRASTDAPEE